MSPRVVSECVCVCDGGKRWWARVKNKCCIGWWPVRFAIFNKMRINSNIFHTDAISLEIISSEMANTAKYIYNCYGAAEPNRTEQTTLFTSRSLSRSLRAILKKVNVQLCNFKYMNHCSRVRVFISRA